MKEKIKTALIHWLGGVTVEESQESDCNSWKIGRIIAFCLVKDYMERINGAPADDWCKKVYSYVVSKLKSTANGTDVERPDTACQADA